MQEPFDSTMATLWSWTQAERGKCRAILFKAERAQSCGCDGRKPCRGTLAMLGRTLKPLRQFARKREIVDDKRLPVARPLEASRHGELMRPRKMRRWLCSGIDLLAGPAVFGNLRVLSGALPTRAQCLRSWPCSHLTIYAGCFSQCK